MKYKFPPPPDLHGESAGRAAPARVAEFEIVACDGAGVYVRFEYANKDAEFRETIALSLPGGLKLAEKMKDAVHGYLHDTGEEIDDG
ncbi:MAG: hypothetical protein OXG25_01830 [Gammaproteobacteria bacterium]|nr:hypothetical protein [Gammaproteobacteria bacterium]